ncbi:hypothetical protein GEMRC1_010628 [Eukaryota sp. GEM-RC1]
MNPSDTSFSSANTLDPFAKSGNTLGNRIHIRAIQRKNKWVTIIEGLPNIFDYRKILKVLRQDLFCNGTVVDDKVYGNVITLQGDHRHNVKLFLLHEDLCEEPEIHIHGAA